MAELWYGHFDSGPGDQRQLLASRWAHYISHLITDGIKNGGTCLQVTAGTGMTVLVDEGMANIHGHMMTLTADHLGRYYQVVVPEAHPQYPRIDRLVLRADMKDLRTVKPVVSIGTAGVTPVPPPLVRDANIWELSLAQIRVNAGVTAIQAGNIADERFDTETCGLINSILGLDPSAWQAQFDAFMTGLRTQSFEDLEQLLTDYQNSFDAWFATIKVDTQRYIQFDFDNLAALSGVTVKPPVRIGDIMTELMVITGSDLPVAQVVTDFSQKESNSILIETETLFLGDGITPLRTTQMITNLLDGSVTTI